MFYIYVLNWIEWYLPGGKRSVHVQATARASINKRSKVTCIKINISELASYGI